MSWKPTFRARFGAITLALASGSIGCSDGAGGGQPTPQREGVDPSFAEGGIAVIELGVSAEAQAVALQADGKIVVAGKRRITHADSYEMLVVRYLADGGLDASFGEGGVVTTNLGDYEESANAVAIQDDGKIVVVGTHYYAQDSQHAHVLARYHADGTPDTAFGSAGVVATETCAPSGQLLGVSLQSDGKIVAAGACSYDFMLARYEANGAPDLSFGVDGLVIESAGNTGELAFAVLVQPDGRIVAAGSALMRFEPNGALDTTFGGGGTAVVNERAFHAVVLDAGGRIVTAGSGQGSGSDFELSRYAADGSLDASFGTDGTALLDVEQSADVPHGLAIRADGKLVAVGAAESMPSSPVTWNWTLMRLDGDGRLDPTFGGDGIVITQPTPDGAVARAVAVQPDGKIVVAGYADSGDIRQIAVVRYEP
jgi:uncharacterized delta-60 repeat protein